MTGESRPSGLVEGGEKRVGRLNGKVAIVTGAGRGIGAGIARLFAAEGARVAVLSLTAANVDAVVGQIVAAGGTATGVTCDVSSIADIDRAVEQVVSAFGTIDILVNNANDAGSVLSSVLDLTEDQLERQLRCGPKAMLRFMQKCYPFMEGRDGRIINLASCAAVRGGIGYAPYAMAKEAVRGLTRVAAREWGAKGITVNCLMPMAITDLAQAVMGSGSIPTNAPMPPVPRFGDVDEDIAPIALFMASPDSRYMTGYSINADGGSSIDAAR